MKLRALSVGAVLEHWVATVAKCGHANVSSSSPELLTIEIVLPTISYANQDEIAALREALEMLHLAALVDVASVEDAVAGLCYHNFAEPEDEDELDGGTKRASCNNPPVSSATDREVEFALTFYGTPGHFLAETIAPSLFANVNGPRSEAFMSARSELFQDREVPRKPIHCRVDVVSMDGGFDDELEEDFIEHFVSFVRMLDEYARQMKREDANQAGASDCVPVRVHSIHVELNEISITEENVAAISALKKSTIPVVCSRVGINPRALTCSADELSAFLQSLGAHSSKMLVEIGHIALDESTQCLDLDGASQDQLVQTLFRGILGARCVTSLSFGPLLAMTSSPMNRKTLWNELFACLTDEHFVAQVSSLIVSPQIELIDEDAVSIEEAASRARPPQIQKLLLWLNESSPKAAQALIKALGANVAAFTLHGESHALTPSQTVETIMRECPQLVKLSLSSAQVETMDIFATENVPLRDLLLSSVLVQESESVSDFLATLSDTTTPLARTLHKFHVKTENNAAAHWVLDAPQAAVLKNVLETNKVLRDVEVTTSDDVPTTTVAAIQSHDREVLAEPLQLAQKLAFLSATQPTKSKTSESEFRSRMDEDVVRLVFAFAAERVARHVYLDF